MLDEADDGDLTQGGYVTYGTPVDIPEADEAAKKRVPVQDQVATDEQGRRRFHGAFTGGFSAGYWNTVGSKEGWTPSTFVSSRKGGAQRGQRPEDFMDEDDMSDFGIAPKLVKSTEQFEAAEQPRQAASTGILAGAELKDLVLPAKDTAGIRLLKLLGWREGQGVGPRQAQPQLSAGYMEEDDNVLAATDAQLHKGRLFAPKDVSIDEFKPKANTFGIGYHGMRPEDFQLNAEKRKSMSGFGVSVLEDDDEDIYQEDNKELYSRVIDEDSVRRPRHVFRKRLNKGPQGFQDDLEVCIRGFSKASVQLIANTMYPPPVVPPDFDPHHKFTTPGPAFQHHVSAVHRQPQLSAAERSRILGEEQVPRDAPRPPAGPVFLSSTVPVPAFPPTPLGRPPQPPPPQGMSSEAAMQPGAFKPFSKQPVKEARYLQFLDGKPVSFPPNTDGGDVAAEYDEFVQAARLYRPMTGAIANRFVTAKLSTLPGADRHLREEEAQETDERTKAVAAKMFGKLTRRVYEWHPASLLCKRMNTPDPFRKSGITGVVLPLEERTVKHKFLDTQHTLQASLPEGLTVEARSAEDEVSFELPAEPERPDIDIFKAIFSGSSSSENEDEEEAAVGSISAPTTASAPMPAALAPLVGQVVAVTTNDRDMVLAEPTTEGAAPKKHQFVPRAKRVASSPPPSPPPVKVSGRDRHEDKLELVHSFEGLARPLAALPPPAVASKGTADAALVWVEKSAHLPDLLAKNAREHESSSPSHKVKKKHRHKEKKLKHDKGKPDHKRNRVPSTQDLLDKVRGTVRPRATDFL